MVLKNNQKENVSAFLVDIINTPDVRNALIDISRYWIQNWSGSGILKQGIGKPAGWVLAKTLSASTTDDLSSVCGNPAHIEALLNEIPRMLHGMKALFLSVAHAVESLPIDRKKAMLDRLFSGFHEGWGDPIFPSIVRTIEEVYKGDPTFFSSLTTPLVERWIAQTDFGELKSLFDASKADIEALCCGAVNILFDYPAKLVAALSVVPDGANLALSVVDQLLGHFNDMPPDVFTDLLLGMAKQLDAKALGRIFKRLNEVVRQLHTGSTLIGEMDAPQFTSDLKEKIRDFMVEIDPALTIKARNALIDGRETVINVLIESAEERPELLNLWLGQLTAKRNSDIRLFKRKVQVLETLPEEDAVAAISSGISSWNAYDLAETVNAIGRMMNRLHAVNPGVIESLVTEFVNTLDRYELEESMDWVCRDLGKAIRPVFRMTAPFVVRELCGFFEPGEDDDGYDETMDQTRQRLRSLLFPKEDKS
ncbi:MAG: hypothetical protein WC799_23185 [Desulfobacteraceae bacterium]|jgi:hypothetical protein